MSDLVYILVSIDKERDTYTGKRFAHLYARDPVDGWGMHWQKPYLYKKVDYDELPIMHRYLKAEYDINLVPLSPAKESTWDIVLPMLDFLALPDDEIKNRPLSEFLAIANTFLENTAR